MTNKGNKKEMSFRKNKYESRSRNDFAISNEDNQAKKTIEVTKYGTNFVIQDTRIRTGTKSKKHYLTIN